MNYYVVDLGRMPYDEAADIQRRALEAVADGHPGVLFLVEHDPVLTLGANFHEGNLLLSAAEYAAQGITLRRTERGGDVTYHGPGQLVVYPVFDVARHGKDLHRWLRNLEEAVIHVLASFDVQGRRFPPHTGVWVGDSKLAAIGIKVRRWVSMHGIAINCASDLSAFDLIVPCGIEGYGVTSLSREVGRVIGIEDVKPEVIQAFSSVFETEFKAIDVKQLESRLPL